MKKILLAAAFALVCTGANAGTCKEGAVDKNGKALAGAALNSYMKKCTNDAKAKCAKETDPSLKGAAKSSHIDKCTRDAIGA